MSSIPRDSSQESDLLKNGIYEFGRFRLDVRQGLLLLDSNPVKISRKTFELLAYLIEHRNRIVYKAELMCDVWAGSYVEEANLTVHIAKLRKLLAEDESAASIETFPKVGYRFNADVREVSNLPATSGPAHVAPSAPEGPAEQLPTGRGTRNVVWIGTAILAVAVVIFGSGYLLNDWAGRSTPRTISISRVPGTERSTSIAFSPNGEYVAHSVAEGGKRTLTMTHVKSGSSLPLLPPDAPNYHGLTFSRDNSFLYFVKSGPEHTTLYKIPILGGHVTRILDRVDNRISFSPDGGRFCFVRKLPGNVTAMMIANADGTGEREVARRTAPQFYSGFEISWSPDGKLIANAAGLGGKVPDIQLIGVEVETGKEVPLSEKKWAGVDGLEWLGDGSGLVGGMFEGPSTPTHVWLVPYPSGEPLRVTSDLENYGSVGTSADGSVIMAGQFKDNTSVWVRAAGDVADARPVRSGKHHKFNWVRWLSDDSFTFGSDAGQNRDVWRMNLNGSEESILTDGPQANVMPVATADGRYIVFASFREESGMFELWRMAADGSAPRPITPPGAGAWQPSVTPDGAWAFYTAGKMDGPPMERRIWKVPVEGGQPALFLDRVAYQPDVSPDGRQVACWIKVDAKAKPQAAIFSIGGGDSIKVFDGPVGNRLDWTPDGKGLSYIVTADGVSNVWTQPIDGGAPRQETRFTSDIIRSFDWSRDGRLLVSRYNKTRDVILIRNFR